MGGCRLEYHGGSTPAAELDRARRLIKLRYLVAAHQLAAAGLDRCLQGPPAKQQQRPGSGAAAAPAAHAWQAPGFVAPPQAIERMAARCGVEVRPRDLRPTWAWELVAACAADLERQAPCSSLGSPRQAGPEELQQQLPALRVRTRAAGAGSAGDEEPHERGAQVLGDASAGTRSLPASAASSRVSTPLCCAIDACSPSFATARRGGVRAF